MPREKIGSIPDFTGENAPSEEPGIGEVKEAPTEEVVEEEKVTPAEPPAEEKPAPLPAEEEKAGEGVDEELELKKQQKDELIKAVQGLTEEREKILSELRDLRGQRRELKEQELKKVEAQIEEIKDVNPEDVAYLDKILKHRGYITKDEAQQIIYENVKKQELDKFLEKFPEYKPENDPNDTRWNTLQREMSYYAKPKDPHLIGELLLKAHKSISPSSISPTKEQIAKKQLETAGLGARIGKGLSPRKSLDSSKKEMLRRGGFTEEDIQKIEDNL